MNDLGLKHPGTETSQGCIVYNLYNFVLYTIHMINWYVTEMWKILVTLDWIVSDWKILDWNVSDWNVLDWSVWDWNVLDWIVRDWKILDWTIWDWKVLDWIVLDWIGSGLKCLGLNSRDWIVGTESAGTVSGWNLHFCSFSSPRIDLCFFSVFIYKML